MEIKQWMQRQWKCDEEIKELQEKIEKAYREMHFQSIGDGEKVQTSRRNTTEERYVKYIEYTELLEKEVKRLIDIKIETERAIERVDNGIQRRVLRMRYIEFKHWEDIAEALCYEVRNVYRIHKAALAAVEIVKQDIDCQPEKG